MISLVFNDQIIVCENNLIDENYTATALVHEAIHAYDFCRAKMDFKNFEHIACTEAFPLKTYILIPRFAQPI